ncbi:DUF2878 domain-containing protein [Polynucleobacter sp. AP-Nino-20-G2]|uniref:DUF2878 domain-containing protein n=1 Tax=Polynucleobacter sp. AP-Nino-20-G2 TaxID=2576917 RepID=UPI001BFD9D13|nr:DUF2878 domain-containing protein [Polynucleobacter sp. AP-Nino-20-G2]QWE16443.1 DUF2878 domain-containing protein [Polynucleobacter sp. AP-Nino-20-G2]
MAKFWNFVFFQLGWFACVMGAANQQVFWPVIGTLLYIAFYIWRSSRRISDLRLIIISVIYGVSADTLIANLGFLSFQGAWPSAYLSPFWMWALWALVASTMNSSLAWLRDRPVLGAVLGAIAGPMSYEAGIRMGAGAWGVNGQVGGLILLGLAWGAAIPLFFYWDRLLAGSSLSKNQP